MPTYASGLSGQVGAVAETTYGTPVTTTHFYEFLSENFVYNPAFLDGAGLKAGQAFNRSTRTVVSQFDVNGDLTMEHTSGEAATAVADSMGFWWKYALGSAFTTPTVVLGTAYQQVHVNGSKAGQFMTVQVGRPQISGVTVQPFTYTGVKLTDWQFSCSDNQIAQLKVTADGQTELTSTGLAAASYPTPNGLFSFANASVFTLGGTATTTAGVTSVASGVAVASRVTGITLAGSTPMKVDRYGLGNSGLKGEPIENAIPTITGTLTTEFFSRTELYDVFKANTPAAATRLHEVRQRGQRRERRCRRSQPLPAEFHSPGSALQVGGCERDVTGRHPPVDRLPGVRRRDHEPGHPSQDRFERADNLAASLRRLVGGGVQHPGSAFLRRHYPEAGHFRHPGVPLPG